jgi:hypothetical protein
MANARAAFIEALDTARTVLASEPVAERWDSPSALVDFSVRGLAGHLARCAIGCLEYLEADEPRDQEPVEPGVYFTRVLPTSDLNAPVHMGVRERGEETATGGHKALVDRFDHSKRRLEAMFAVESPARLVRVFGDVVMRLDDYLETRIVEALVHTEDLAVSVGMEPPAPPEDALEIALDHLLDVARRRHGPVAILRALTRRERDDVEALRIF